VVQEIRSNQQQEQDLSIMDIKIGLLVRNRLSIEDVVSHTQQVCSLHYVTLAALQVSHDNKCYWQYE